MLEIGSLVDGKYKIFVPVSRTYKAVLSEKWKQRKEKLWG